MEELIKILPSEINTVLLIGIVLFIYKAVLFINIKVKKIKDTKKLFEKEVIEKEQRKASFEQRVLNVEKDIIAIRRDFKEKNAENKEDFGNLSSKLDKILDILLQPIKR